MEVNSAFFSVARIVQTPVFGGSLVNICNSKLCSHLTTHFVYECPGSRGH